MSDTRVTMSQYNKCSCGRIKARQAKQCERCWSLERRVRDRDRQRMKFPCNAMHPVHNVLCSLHDIHNGLHFHKDLGYWEKEN